ncbi:MAG: prepilin peptidase [Thermoguttaceae bacterium]|nr:prepilin peptidase [Thermoguttaceae bacterium]
MSFEPEFLQQIKPDWVEWFLSRPALAQLIIVFLVSWAMAWAVNRYSRYVAIWFDLITRSIPNGSDPADYVKSARRAAKLETFFWTPLFAAALTGVYALFVHRGGVADLLLYFEVGGWTTALRSIWDANLFHPMGLQNFIGFFVLSIILLAATLCDVRRKIIPDMIPLAGIAAGIALALTTQTLFVHVELYKPLNTTDYALIPISNQFTPLTFAAPYLAPNWDLGTKILLACGCWAFFAFAFLFRPIRLRRIRRRLGLYFLRLVRDRVTYATLAIAVIGLSATIWTLCNSDVTRQNAVLSSLFGMTFAGLAVWAVRIVGRLTLGMEAIGFGDVTLMMAIGVFTGWQAIPIIFFLSPATGLIVGVIMLFCGQRHVPLGPFLCLTTAIWFLCFDFLWDFCLPMLLLGASTVITILLVCLALMAAMLWIIQIIKFKWLLTQTKP